MLTKGDLAAIQRMFDSSKKETNEKFISMDKRFDGMDKRLDNMDKRLDNMDKRLDNMNKRLDELTIRVDGLANSLQKNTEELVELISAGFDSYEKRMQHVEEKVFKTN